MKFIYGSILLFFGMALTDCSPKTQLPDYTPRKTSVSKYLDFLEEGSTEVYSGYNFLVEKTKDGKFIHKTFYPENQQITQFYTYADKAMKEKEGLAKEWWDNGDLRFEGQYENGNRFGNWKYHYYSKGKYSLESGKYNDNLRQGRWTLVDATGILLREMNYKNGKKEGAFKKYNAAGELVKQSVYVDDEPTEVETFGENEEGNTDAEDVDRMPSWKGCEQEEDKELRKKCTETGMLRYVYGKIKYPERARRKDIEGMALANFVINKEGEITELKVPRGISQDIKKEVIRVVSKMPDWNPGMKNGQPVKVHYTLPVSFKLQ